MRITATAVATALLIFSTAARASGSASVDLISTTFRYTYTENSRKIFVDGDSARDYYEGEEQSLKLRFLSFQTSVERVLAVATKGGAPIAPYDLLQTEIPLRAVEDVTTIDAAAFPANLVLDFSDEEASERISITLLKRPTAARLREIRSELLRLVRREPTMTDEAAVKAAGFVAPFAVTHIDQRFALYAGTTAQVMTVDQPRLKATLQAALDAMVPGLKQKFAQPDAAAQLNMKGLMPVAPQIAKHPQGLPGAFHPWGPLFGSTMVRITAPLGSATAILMIAPQQKPDDLEWPKVHPVMSAWLTPLATSAHQIQVEKEVERLRALRGKKEE